MRVAAVCSPRGTVAFVTRGSHCALPHSRATSGADLSAGAEFAACAFAPRDAPRSAGTGRLTVIVLGVWAVTSDAIGWLSGWRRADPGRLCRLLVWLSKVMSPAAAR
jgi:hypothetical protein